MNDNVNIANINIDFNDLMYKWMSFTKPFHNLRKREQQVVAELLLHYFSFKKLSDDESIIWKMVFDYDTKVKIMDKLDMNHRSLLNHLSNLRKKNVIRNNRVVNMYIPNIKSDTKQFKLVYNFNIK